MGDLLYTNEFGGKEVTTWVLRGFISWLWNDVEEMSLENQEAYHSKMKICLAMVNTVFAGFCLPKTLNLGNVLPLPPELMLQFGF
jgi:hypothetical protein